MKKLVLIILVSSFLSGCAYFRTHKIEVIQGNVLSQDEIQQIHRGMTEEQLKSILGSPMLVNLFDDNRINYIYDYISPTRERTTTRLTLTFRGGRLQEIVRG